MVMFKSLKTSLALAHSRSLTKRGFAAVATGDVQPFRIPLIDFSRFRAATSQAEKKQTADEIVSAFKESGFIYLGNHGIPTGTTPAV